MCWHNHCLVKKSCFLPKYVPVFEALVEAVCQGLILIKMYLLCTICLEFGFRIVPKPIKLTRLMIRLDFWTWRHCYFLTSEYFSYQHLIIVQRHVDGENADVYVEIFLTIVNGFQSLIIKTKRSIGDFASVLDPSLNTIERR